MRRIKREDEEGAMGVGTLIIFIAMVLVAAVAASVLIDTANQLQQQAQRTGDEAIQEVSSSFKVQDVYGESVVEDNGDREIRNVTLKVSLSAGANPQDLNQTVVQVQSSDWEVNLQAQEDEFDDAEEDTHPDDEHYAWEQIIIQEEENDRERPFVESGDLYKIMIDLDALETNDNVDEGPLGTQARLDINIMPKHGTPTYEQITTPSTLTTKIVSL